MESTAHSRWRALTRLFRASALRSSAIAFAAAFAMTQGCAATHPRELDSTLKRGTTKTKQGRQRPDGVDAPCPGFKKDCKR